MNKYGAQAMDHSKTHQPQRFATIEDPTSYFSDLGEQIAERVEQICLHQESSERDLLNQMPYLERVGRINAIRKSAEEVVLTELVWTQPPKPSPPTTEDSSVSMDQRLAALGAVWDPEAGVMPADRSHPVWTTWVDSIAENATKEQEESFEPAYREWLRANPGLLHLPIQ